MEKMRCHKSSIVIKSIHQMSFWFLALIYGIVSAIAEGSDEQEALVAMEKFLVCE